MRCFAIIIVIILFFPLISAAEEKWAQSIETTTNWAAFPCKNYFITVVCRTYKNYTDPGSLPTIISVGDIIQYKDRKGESHDFHVKAINFFLYKEDVDVTYGEQKYTARKGDTTCSLYDSVKAHQSQDYLSKIVIKGCRFIN